MNIRMVRLHAELRLAGPSSLVPAACPAGEIHRNTTKPTLATYGSVLDDISYSFSFFGTPPRIGLAWRTMRVHQCTSVRAVSVVGSPLRYKSS
jgi:hypothetical protein